MISVMPASTSASMHQLIMGRSKIGNRCLLVIRVSGCSREPVPPARMTPFTRRSLDPAVPRASGTRSPVHRCPVRLAGTVGPLGALGSAGRSPGHLGQDGIGQAGPGPCRPQPEPAVGELSLIHISEPTRPY